MTTTPPAAGLISLTASSSRRAQKEVCRERQRLKNSLHFSEKWLRFQQPRAEQHLFDARHILSALVEEKNSKMHVRDATARRCVALKGK
jgi:hypothetical protein